MENIINNIENIIKTTTDENTAAELQRILDSWNLTQNMLNSKTKSITLGGQEIKLTNQEYRTLEFLANAEKPMNRVEIRDGAWEFAFVGSRTVDVHIRKLRKKLGNDIIETRKGLGYTLGKTLTIC